MNQIKIILVAIVLLLTTQTYATVYEDAEDESTSRWQVYDKTPVGAYIDNVYLSDRDHNAIEFIGEGTSNGYILGNWESEEGAWNNTKEHTLKWSMNFNEEYTVYVRVMTKEGGRYIQYSANNTDGGKVGNYIKIGLGNESNNGTWQNFKKDLAADLEKYEPNNELMAVNAFLVRGNGLVDDVELIEEGNSNILHGAKLDNSGDGSYYQWDDTDAARGLVFNAHQDFILNSVKVYNQKAQAATRVFTLYNASGNIVASESVYVKEGEQRIALNMQVPKGNGYKLMADIHKGLYKNNNVTGYPYKIGNTVSIISSDLKNAHYYFFYDWEVVVEESNEDKVAPVIVLNGSETINLNLNDNYTELGATVKDNKDSTVDVVISGDVDTSKKGTYIITYLAVDEAGNRTTKKRTIIVEKSGFDTVSGLSDYSFIGEGYGSFTKPSQPAPGVQVPYVPELNNIEESDVIYVSPNGTGNGNTKSSPAKLKSILKDGLRNKTIIALDGIYYLSIVLKDIHNVNFISYNKLGAKLVGQSQSVFDFGNSNTNVENFSIIGFEATSSNKRYFIFSAGNASTFNVHNIYISDMKLHDFSVTIYGGLHSHDWTVDKTLHYDSAGSYLWYMMGWHNAVINSVMYNNARTSIAIRGSYPPNETYDYYNHENNILITNRKKHFLSDNDWSHMIVNNTFSSNYKNNRNIKAHIGIYYQTPSDEKNKHMAEDVYYPPKNILIANNIFIDKGHLKKHPIHISAERGINIRNKAVSVNGIYIKNNFTDRDRMVGEYTYSIESVDLGSNHTNISENSFGFIDNGNRNYNIKETSILKDAGTTNIWTPNVDMTGNTRDEFCDVGAYEVK